MLARPLALVVLVLMGCPRPREEASKVAPTSAVPSGTPSVATSVAPSTSPSKVEPASGLLPALETACASDADCSHAWTYEIAGKCCSGTCSPKPTTRGWVERVAKICEKAGHSPDCPVKKCVAPPPVVCKAGNCVLGTGTDPKW